MTPGRAESPNRSRWMRAGRACMAAGDWAGAIRAYAQGLMEQPLLGMHYAANLQRARTNYRKERQQINQQGPAHTTVVVAAAELSHNAAGRAYTLAQLYRHMGHPVTLLGSHFPQWGRELWEPIRGAVRQQGLPVHSFVVEHEPNFVNQAWELVLQHPADLVHLSKPRLPAVVFGLLYKLLWGAAVLVDIDDEELLFVGAREPITLDGLKRLCHGLPEPRELMGPLWTRLAVDLAQRFDGITVANRPLQERYGGTVIPHARDPERLKPATPAQKAAARQRFGVPATARVILFFGTPKRHKGILELARAVAQLPEGLQSLLVVAGAFAPEDAALEQELRALLPNSRLQLLGNQPVEQAPQVLALADLVVLLSEGEVAAFQSPAKLSDALAMGLPALVSEAAPLLEMVEMGWALEAEQDRLEEQLRQWLGDKEKLALLGEQARTGFENALALGVVAPPLRELALGVTAAAVPAGVDGQQLTVLESLALDQAGPLLADRYWQWSRWQIAWAELQAQQRDPELVSIVVPVYGDPAELDGCLQALKQAESSRRWELIAVMNDASPQSQTVLKAHQQGDTRIRAVWPGENVQFALGCNLGFAACGGAAVVFLNNDCRVQNGWLEALLAPLADPEVAAVQPRLLKPDGTVQCLGVVFRQGQTIGYPLYAGLDGGLGYSQKEHRLQAITGACMAVHSCDFAAVQGFDAGFINSQEDVDLCLRLQQLPNRQVCVSTPACTVVHSESVAPSRFRHSRWSRLRFVRRWRGERGADDETIYAADGIVVSSWLEDSADFRVAGIGAGRAVLQCPQHDLRYAIAVHIFYLDLWPEISEHLSSLALDFDLHVTCCPNLLDDVSEVVRACFPSAEIHCFQNKGMDVLPFLRLLPLLKGKGYSVVCKLHTKRGVEPLGSVWRQHLISSLVGNRCYVQAVLKSFSENPGLMMAGPSNLYVSAKLVMYKNRLALEQLHKILCPESRMPEDWGFFAGSMFWVRIDRLLPIASAAEQLSRQWQEDLGEAGNSDGGFAHAVERAFGWAAWNHQLALLDEQSCWPLDCQAREAKIDILRFGDAGNYLQRSHLSEILANLRAIPQYVKK